MGFFGVCLLFMFTGGFYLFDIKQISSSRERSILARVIGGIFFVVGTLMALLVGLAWILGHVFPLALLKQGARKVGYRLSA